MTTAARRQQLIDTARSLFAARGFRGTTTRELARAAGVTEAVIFQHFRDKDALYAAILEQRAADPHADTWFDALDTASRAGDDDRLLRTLYTGLIDQHDRDPHILRLMLHAALEDHPLASRMHARGTRLYHLLHRHIIDGQRTGRLADGDPAVLVRAVLALPIYHQLQRRVLRTPWPSVDRTRVIETGVRFALTGLGRHPADRLEGAASGEKNS
jgi:TetR/AcrR family transcriptional regulator